MSLNFRTILFPVLILGGLLASSCEGQKPAATAPAGAAKPSATPAVEAARYECSMGCAGSQSSKPGKCPTCKMELVKKS